MASSYGSLAKEAIVLLDKFSAGRQCLDDFMEDVSKDLQVGTDQCPDAAFADTTWICLIDIYYHLLQDMDTLHRKFILDVVSGCIEHKKLLDVVINVFYGQNGKCLSRGDRSQFVSK